eukprot:12973015-Alexandrium_andersonii.AAC.1
MSASLVGSEMCIRDRVRHLCEKRRRTHPSRASGTRFEAVSEPAQFQAVSYTHLTLPTICSV